MLVVDVEGTIFEAFKANTEPAYRSTMWHALATVLGPEAMRHENATHATWTQGGYASYIEWVLATVDIHRRHGLTKATFDRVLSGVKYQPGVRKALQDARSAGWEIVLITGGFRELAARAQRDLGITHAFAACEYMFDENGALQSANILPSDFEAKRDIIRMFLNSYRIPETSWAFVGDGKNDVAIAKSSPLAIGYRAEPELAAVCQHNMQAFSELADLLEKHGPR